MVELEKMLTEKAEKAGVKLTVIRGCPYCGLVMDTDISATRRIRESRTNEKR